MSRRRFVVVACSDTARKRNGREAWLMRLETRDKERAIEPSSAPQANSKMSTRSSVARFSMVVVVVMIAMRDDGSCVI